MSDFVPKKLSKESINNGQKLNNGYALNAQNVNDIIEGVLYNNENSGSGGTTETDKTLTIENAPADAKAVGEALLKNILNVQIIDQDLSKADFVPTPNTYYRHTNKYNVLYNYGTIRFYNGNDWEDVKTLNNLVSEWSGLAAVIGGYGTILSRNTQGKYTAVGIGNASVTKVGFVPTYAERTDANGVKSTVLATGNPVNNVDATPKQYVDNLVASKKLYAHDIYCSLKINEEENNNIDVRFRIYSTIQQELAWNTVLFYIGQTIVCVTDFKLIVVADTSTGDNEFIGIDNNLYQIIGETFSDTVSEL